MRTRLRSARVNALAIRATGRGEGHLTPMPTRRQLAGQPGGLSPLGQAERRFRRHFKGIVGNVR